MTHDWLNDPNLDQPNTGPRQPSPATAEPRPRLERSTIVGAAAVLVLLGLIVGASLLPRIGGTAAASTPTPSGNSPRPSTSAPTSTPTPTSAAPGPTITPVAPRSPLPSDTIDVVAKTNIYQAAAGFMIAYARPRPGVTRDQWWAGVSQWLTPQAQQEYQYVDPATVPWTKLTETPALIAPAEEGSLVRLVEVTTDAGVFVVVVDIRTTKVQRFIPPANVVRAS